MTARITWKLRSSVRGIEKRARQTTDPLERLRYVRNQMDSREIPDPTQWRLIRRIAAWITAVIVVALLVWWIR